MSEFIKVFIDTETYSEIDLLEVGSYAYAEHPSTEIMICTWADEDEDVRTWDATAGSDMPRDLKRIMRKASRWDGGVKLVMANGLLFDRLVFKHCWGYDIPAANIIDTKVLALRHSLPASLAALCFTLDIADDIAKDKDGKRLINIFSKPTPKNHKIRRHTSATKPEEWARFLHYAATDITSMREVYYRIPSWGDSAIEDAILEQDILINDRGFFVDEELAEKAIAAVEEYKENLKAEVQETHGIAVGGNDFRAFMQELVPHVTLYDMAKPTMEDLLADPDVSDEAKELVAKRMAVKSNASSKYKPLLLGRSADGRLRGCLQYQGASRTGRWTGKLFQPQNLARGFFHDDVKKGKFELTYAINAILSGRAGRRYDVSKLTASTVRSCLIPEQGNKFVVADYSNVEGRGLAWLAGEETALKVFRDGLDIYCVTAGKMFGLDPDFIKANRSDLRQIGKACELGLGYQGGVAAFLTFAKNLGLNLYEMTNTMDGTFPDDVWNRSIRNYEFARIRERKLAPKKGERDERASYILPRKVWMTCESIKIMWRESHPKTERLWAQVESAAMDAINNPGETFYAGNNNCLKFSRSIERDGTAGWWLRITLPSGRILSYPGVGKHVTREEDEDTGKMKTSTSIKYINDTIEVFADPKRKKPGDPKTWKHYYAFTYGGKLVENIVQAMCRDLLGNALLEVEKGGYPIVLHVHDEIVAETPDTPEYNVPELEKLMCKLPEWADGFPLVAEGDEMMRYAK